MSDMESSYVPGEQYYTWDKAWDCEMVCHDKGEATDSCIEEFFEGDPVPETVTIYELRSVPDEPEKEFIDRLVDMVEDLHGQYSDSPTPNDLARCKMAAESAAKHIYRYLSLSRLELTGREEVINVQQWIIENPTCCEWARKEQP